MMDREQLHRLDEALIRLRRLGTAPSSRPVDVQRWPGVELSTVLVADAVRRLVHERPGDEPTVAAVAARLDVAASTASRLVGRAVNAGVVERVTSARDARRAVLALTSSGRQLVTDAEGFRHAYLARLVGDWEAADVTRLAELLTRLADAVHTQTSTPSGSADQYQGGHLS